MSDTASPHPYVGRFAPSPSGQLHFGSLVTALGSYLQARAAHGRWLVRIEDIDPPREVAGAADHILRTLEHYRLEWDASVLYQSQRFEAYHAVLNQLQRQRLTYFCTCSRQRLQKLGGLYDGHCRTQNQFARPAALRLRQTRPIYGFQDALHGWITVNPRIAEEDFIIYRKDNWVAYNLAVVIDDDFQGVTEVVRGADLLTTTVRQLSLYQHLNRQAPQYLHLPLALDRDGNKLSKQNHAAALPLGDPRPYLLQALRFLGQSVEDEMRAASTEAILNQAIKQWSLDNITKNLANSSD